MDDDTEHEWCHVFPNQDVRDHDLVGTECWCSPEIDWDDFVVIHRCEHERRTVH